MSAHAGDRIRCVVRVRPAIGDARAEAEPCLTLDGERQLTVRPAGAAASANAPATPTRRAETPQRSHAANGLRTPHASPSARGARTPSGMRTPGVDGAGPRAFTFDRVLPPSASQDDVWALCAPYVDAALDGYNACIFAYGQTGSGKTHTMLGDRSAPGVVPRVCDALFAGVGARPDTEFHLSCTYVELYNNEFKDLLSPENQPGRARELPFELEERRRRPPISLHELPSARGHPPAAFLSGSQTLRTPVRSAAELHELIGYGAAARATGATRLNEHSSRSHAVLTLHVESRSADAAVCRLGKLHLVDLAGSENLTLSGAEGAVRAEAQAINSSLTALCDVLEALSKRSTAAAAGGRAAAAATPIPYRNHKLTRLLADSIGGNSKTLMLTTVLPFGACHRQTLMAVHFAARARAIRAHAAPVVNEDVDESGMLAQLRTEVESLKAKLRQRDLEIALIEKSSAERSEAEASALRARLEALDGARRRDQERLGQRLSEVHHLRAVDVAEGRYRHARLELQLRAREGELHAARVEQCSMLEDAERLQDRLDDALGKCRALQGVRAQLSAAHARHAEDGAALEAALGGWQADRSALETALGRARQLEAELGGRQQAGEEAAKAGERERAKLSAELSASQAEVAKAREAAERAQRDAQDAAKAGKRERAKLSAELSASQAEVAKAREAAERAQRDAQDARDALDARTVAEGTLRRRLGALEGRLQHGHAALAQLDACVAEARALPALQTRLRGIAASARVLSAQLPPGGAAAEPAQPHSRSAPPAARAPEPAAALAQPASPSPVEGAAARSPFDSAGVSAVLGIAHDEQDAHVAATLGTIKHGVAGRAAAEAARVAPDPARPSAAAPRARSGSKSERTSGSPPGARKSGRHQAEAAGATDGADDDDAHSGRASAPRAGARKRNALADARAETAGERAEESRAVEAGSPTAGQDAARDAGAAHAPPAQPLQPRSSGPAAGRPSRRASKRSFTPEQDEEAREEAEAPKGEDVSARARGGGKQRRSSRPPPPDELTAGPPLEVVAAGRTRRASSVTRGTGAADARIASDKENPAPQGKAANAETAQGAKRRQLFNPRRRASHAFKAMV